MQVRREIDEGLREDLLAPEDAKEISNRPWQIQYGEAREFHEHRWNLPDYDRSAISSQLDELDHLADRTRDEP